MISRRARASLGGNTMHKGRTPALAAIAVRLTICFAVGWLGTSLWVSRADNVGAIGVPEPTLPGPQGTTGPPAAGLYRVNSTADRVDENLADNICSTGAHVGNQKECTLRAAIQEANDTAAADAVGIDLSGMNNPPDHPFGARTTFLLTIEGPNEDNCATGDLDIKSNVIIKGSGPDRTIIDGRKIDRVFDVHSHNVTFDSMTIRGGSLSTGNGGGIRINQPGESAHGI